MIRKGSHSLRTLTDRPDRRRWIAPLGLLAAIHVTVISSPAYAQDTSVSGSSGRTDQSADGAGPDMITLKTGGFLRGTLLEAIPGSQARIQIKGGTIATVRWSDIDHIDKGNRDLAPLVAAAAHPNAMPAPLGTVNVHIDSDNPVELQTHADPDQSEGFSGWRTVCFSPCDRDVPLGQTYRVVGEGTRASHGFRLNAQPGQRLLLDVTPRSGGMFALGIVATVIGGVALPIGLLVLLAGAVENATTRDGGSTVAAGWTITGLGVAGIVGGILLIVNNSKTKVDQEAFTGTDSGRAPEARLPVWRDTGSDARRGEPKALAAVPILSGSF